MFNMAMGAVRSATQDLGGGQVVFDPVFLDGVDSLEAGLGSLFSDKCPPTAIVCLSWTLLSGIRGLLHQMELSVPGDVSLIGYGQSAGHLNLVPSLTCIEASKEHETLAAINLLTEMLPHKDRYAPKLSFPTWLVTRQSTSRAKSGGR
jgi:DNA-binding LacI/PurR family transcriptional regulator